MNVFARSWATATVGVLAVLLAVAVGVALRLDDPLSSPVIPAEDPYTHMALVREHIRDGNMDPLNPGGALYPPGLHSFVAAMWVYSGIELYEIVRLGPVAFGALGVLGIALLLWRYEGPAAAFAGAMAFAVAPEVIFRSTMMAPTALDLALVPFLLFALLQVVQGRLGWAGVAAPLSVFLVFAHPWLFLVVGLAGVLFTILALAVPWSDERLPPLSARGLAAAVAIAAGCIPLADATARGFRGTLNLPEGFPYGPMIAATAFIALIPILFLLLAPDRLDRLLPSGPRKAYPWWVRLGISGLIVVALVMATTPALEAGFPDQVDLARMFGMPILVLAAIALVALPFLPSPTAHMGAAVFAATYPFVIYNPLESEFWPHRTAVFMGIGLVLLVGVAAAGVCRLTTMALHWFEERRAQPAGATKSGFIPTFAGMAIALFVALSVGGGVYAGTPVAYEGGWYRLYQPCELDSFREIADELDAQPDAIIITGDWQAKLVLAALTTDASRIWYKPSFFLDPDVRENDISVNQRKGVPLYVLVDRHFRPELPDADPSFLEGSPWVDAGTWCDGLGGFAQPSVRLYRLEEVSR